MPKNLDDLQEWEKGLGDTSQTNEVVILFGKIFNEIQFSIN